MTKDKTLYKLIKSARWRWIASLAATLQFKKAVHKQFFLLAEKEGRNKLNRFVLISLLISLSGSLYAQVTVGCGELPRTGALLDLKENTNVGVNSKKGLVLPRVTLNNITPATPAELAKSIGNTGTWNMNEHIGLTVYNMNEDQCAEIPIYKGPYVWTGDMWALLYNKNRNASSQVYMVYDKRDGDSYPARSFGDAGHWLLENMRYYSSDFIAADGMINAPSERKVFAYPRPVPSNAYGNPPAGWKKRDGLLYSWAAATLAPVSSAELYQGQDDKDESTLTVMQGVCPEGWHVPSDREWNMLEKEIYNNPQLYSSYTSLFSSTYNSPIGTSNKWQALWETGFTIANNPPTVISGFRYRGATPSGSNLPGHAHAMTSPCAPDAPANNTGPTYGKSFIAHEGGFAVIPVGFVSYGHHYVSGVRAAMWATSKNNIGFSYHRDFDIQRSQVERHYLAQTSLLSVRCKRD